MRSLAVVLLSLASCLTPSFGLGSQCTAPLGNGTAAEGDPYWLQNMSHVGTAAFNPSPSTYKVYRNVKDYGAVGNGIDDDTAVSLIALVSTVNAKLGNKAINAAIAG
jgi:glucan 1,3-beta-glucosidase